MTRKIQFGWMALGGTLCLFGVVLVFKMQDGSQAAAQAQATNNASVAAAAGPLAAVLFGPAQVAQADAPKPIPEPAALPIPSVIVPGPRPLPPVDKKETAEPPFFQTVGFQTTLPAKPAKPVVRPEPRAPSPNVAPPPQPPTPPPAAQPAPAEANKPARDNFPRTDGAFRSLPLPEVAPARFDKQPSPTVSAVPPPVVPLPPQAKVPAAAPSPAVMQVNMEEVKPLPTLRAQASPIKAKLMPLTGTFVGKLDDRKILSLPRTLHVQLAPDGGVLVSPGSETCLWLTTPAHLERLAERLEHSRARAADVQAFRRLYFAQAEKATITSEGRVVIPDRLAQFAGLDMEVVLVGIDDHIEVWDVGRWKRYTQEKSAAARAAVDAE